MPYCRKKELFWYVKCVLCIKSDIVCLVVCWHWSLMSVPFEFQSYVYFFHSFSDCLQKWTKWRNLYVNLLRNQTIVSVWLGSGNWISLVWCLILSGLFCGFFCLYLLAIISISVRAQLLPFWCFLVLHSPNILYIIRFFYGLTYWQFSSVNHKWMNKVHATIGHKYFW
jgi:hypothetical protein